MIVMPANSSGWFWHCLARETGKIGHLFSPRAQRGPWPWFPYALDNGAFSCWNPKDNSFDEEGWANTEQAWRELLFWSQAAPIKPMWAIVADRPGDKNETLRKWSVYAKDVVACGIAPALAVQDGMVPEEVAEMTPAPAVIAVGGSTEWKWATVEIWASSFPRVHLLRCNQPDKLDWLEGLGIESTDGTGWGRGHRHRLAALENWCRKGGRPTSHMLAQHALRGKDETQMSFA